jgi:hypothetical protein
MTQTNTETTGSARFFSGLLEFDTLLYGHFMPHKENTTPPVSKIILGVPEYMGAQVQVEFDMPNPEEVGETCGIVIHGK